MPPKHSTIASLVAVFAMAAVGCESTALSTSWKDPAAGPLSFQNVVVAVLNSSPGQRRAQEDTLVAQVHRAKATASYKVVSDEELGDPRAAKAKIIAAGFDGAVVVRLAGKQDVTTVVPGSSWDDGWHGGTYHSTPGYSYTDTLYRAEISLYSVPDGKLIWSGNSVTLNPADERAFAVEVAKATGAELRKQGLLR